MPQTCTVDELKAAWRKKAKLIHPDLNNGDKRKTEIFVEAKELYEKALKWKEDQAKQPAAPSIDESFINALRQQQAAQQWAASSSNSHSFFRQFFGGR